MLITRIYNIIYIHLAPLAQSGQRHWDGKRCHAAHGARWIRRRWGPRRWGPYSSSSWDEGFLGHFSRRKRDFIWCFLWRLNQEELEHTLTRKAGISWDLATTNIILRKILQRKWGRKVDDLLSNRILHYFTVSIYKSWSVAQDKQSKKMLHKISNLKKTPWLSTKTNGWNARRCIKRPWPIYILHVHWPSESPQKWATVAMGELRVQVCVHYIAEKYIEISYSHVFSPYSCGCFWDVRVLDSTFWIW